MGDHPEHLAALVGGDGRNAVVIANALDDAPADVRRSGLERELAALADLGFDAVELDLRDYFGQEQRLRRDLAGVALAWLRGAMRSCSATRSSTAPGTSCSVTCLRQMRWSTPDTAPQRGLRV
jgi:dipeptidase E